MTYALVVTLIAIALALLTVYMAVLEARHRSLIADIEARLQEARSTLVTDAKGAKAKLDAVLASIKAALP